MPAPYTGSTISCHLANVENWVHICSIFYAPLFRDFMVHTYTDIVVVVVEHTFACGHRRPADGRERRTMAAESGVCGGGGQTASKTETAYVGWLSRVPLVGEGPRSWKETKYEENYKAFKKKSTKNSMKYQKRRLRTRWRRSHHIFRM